eukprot:3142781-Pleurochrysis_carterae.AAC.2
MHALAWRWDHACDANALETSETSTLPKRRNRTHTRQRNHNLAALATNFQSTPSREYFALKALRIWGEAPLQLQMYAQQNPIAWDLEQLVVGQEVEAREGDALGLEVLGEPLLHELEHAIALLEALQDARRLAEDKRVTLVARRRHELAPCAVNARKPLGLGRQLPHDVFGRKDGFQVHPLALAAEPFVKRLGDEAELCLPLVDSLRKRALERREGHRLRHDDVVVEELLDRVGRLQDECQRVLVRDHAQLGALPLDEHLVERLLNAELLAGRVADLYKAVRSRIKLRVYA